MHFDKAYTKYWSSTVNKSVDGTIIAGAAQVEDILRYLSIEQNENLLDLGCSFGRLHDVLTQYSKNLFGVDVDPYAVEKAERLPYKKVRVGSGEKISFDNDPASTASWGGAATWHISNWEDGTTEPGSSGSPLFNQDGRVIGQLYGGTANCSNNIDDYYGRFDVSWASGGAANVRLSPDWCRDQRDQHGVGHGGRRAQVTALYGASGKPW